MRTEDIKQAYALYKVCRAGLFTFEEFAEMLNNYLGD